MDINKAIRKQNKVYNSFVLSMCFIFFALPIIMIFLNKENLFYLLYLCIIEILILITVTITINNEYLKYECKDYKIIIKSGLFLGTFHILAEKVALVHAQDESGSMNIILIMTSRFRNRKIKPVNQSFLLSHAYLSHHYYRLKKQHSDEEYFYLIIDKGGYNKYKFLKDIYKLCVRAYFTDEAIERIKEIQT